MSGDGRSAAVWALNDGRPRLLHAGPHALKHILKIATRRLAAGEEQFEVLAEPGVRGSVYVLRCGGESVAYGLFIQGAGQTHLAETIDQLITEGEAAIGTRVSKMSRAQKQQLVGFLDDRGAFLVRRAAGQVADRLGVSRFTVYNYIDRESD
jgi:hypothetical protein